MRKILKILIIITIVLFILNNLFKIKITKVDVIGNDKVSSTEIVSKFFHNDYDRHSIVFFLKSKLEKKKNIPLISSYEIIWLTPSNIRISVTENKAIAFMKRDLKNVYFDKNGTIVEMTEERIQGVVEIIGVSFKNYERGNKIEISNTKILNAILQITNYLKEHNLDSELLEIKKEEEIYIYMGNIVVNMGNVDNMETKLLRLSDIYPTISHLNGTLDLSNARENMLDEQYIFKKAS